MKRIKLKLFGSTMLAGALLATSALPSFADGGSAAATEPAAFELTATKAAKVARVTGPTLEGETVPNPNRTHVNYALRATDLGIVWDATTDPNDKKVMVAFGDSYDDGWGGFGGGGDPAGWRSNLLAISKDADLSDGMAFSSMIMDENKPGYSKEVIGSEHDTSGSGDFTAIPTAGVTVGSRHYIHYMQIKNWGANGRWNTNFSEIAYSDDEGQNWTKSGVQWGAKSKFAQAAYLKEDGYVYMFGTPAGRFDNAYLARAAEADMLVKEQYEYWNGTGWTKNDEAAAVAVVDVPVSELSVAYNSYYDKYIMTYLNENRYAIVMRSSSSLTGGWSAETEVVRGAEYPGLYGGFIHPWTNDGRELYMVVSEWGPYNSILMRATLDVGTPQSNLVADPSFEMQTSDTISAPWTLENGKGGIDRAGLGRGGSQNVWLRNSSGWNAITQDVAVEANTEYVLQGFVRTSQNNNGGYFGVRGSANDILKETKFERNDNYSKLSVRFNSGNNTQVKIFTGMHANGDTWVQVDDYMLLKVDTTPPVITLNGAAAVDVPLGGTYDDAGAAALDAIDGDLSGKIAVEGAVDPTIVGTYTLTYKVSDSDGNAAEPVTRTVKVTGPAYSVTGAVFKDILGRTITKLPKNGLVTASADVRNNTGESKTVTVVAALFNKKGEIVNVSGVTKSIASGAKETFTGGFTMPGNNSGYRLKVFVASSLSDLRPISAVAELK
ncbi:DUF4185 domain-containing protein [Paenibacillus arenilitoris]|uniref:DUF4185 domain-containing protein n=1 Tax=Paenibacillus arenilitoris TaxID=2772299 RepID=A0A927H401_9BACL|nr:DUF4185 domain-containing protein [Paenibacillus arenilitoris]MBD2867395.1 DUF4185 domain-containing protein [Paenibacillus arenilitoris]